VSLNLKADYRSVSKQALESKLSCHLHSDTRIGGQLAETTLSAYWLVWIQYADVLRLMRTFIVVAAITFVGAGAQSRMVGLEEPQMYIMLHWPGFFAHNNPFPFDQAQR